MSQNLIAERAATQSTFSSNMPFVESLIVTYLSYCHDKKTSLFLEAACSKTSTMLSFIQSGYTCEVNLANCPHFVLDITELSSENLAIANLMGA
jgi:hypothetical protein